MTITKFNRNHRWSLKKSQHIVLEIAPPHFREFISQQNCFLQNCSSSTLIILQNCSSSILIMCKFKIINTVHCKTKIPKITPCHTVTLKLIFQHQVKVC